MADISLAVASLKPELWTSSSNEATNIFVTDTAGHAHAFKPQFTYPIFGDAETIFGYQGLQIFLCFDSVTFLPFLNVKYSEKLAQVDVDPKEKLLEVLPESTIFKDEVKWRDAIDAEQKDFKIPGKIVGESWTNGDDTYAVYKLDMAADAGVELLKRIQILVLLFIEAGTYIEHSDPLWDVYVMYRVTDPALPEVVGFTTAYNYWKYPGAQRFDAGESETRKKISQFIVLPTFQGKLLGRDMYTTLYKSWLQESSIVEIVVEDPNESFDDLRDRSDFTRLVESGKLDLSSFSVAEANKPDFWNALKSGEKLEKRQLQRLLEMALFYQQQHNVARDSPKTIRLFVKKRLFEKNKEALDGMDEPTRLDKLQTAFETLKADYLRILEPVKVSVKRKAEGSSSSSKKTKQ